MTAVNKNILRVFIAFVLVAAMISYFYPKEIKVNSKLSIGSNMDISGIVISEALKNSKIDKNLIDVMEFGDC